MCAALLVGGGCSSDDDPADSSADTGSPDATGESRTPDPNDPITFAETSGGCASVGGEYLIWENVTVDRPIELTGVELVDSDGVELLDQSAMTKPKGEVVSTGIVVGDRPPEARPQADRVGRPRTSARAPGSSPERRTTWRSTWPTRTVAATRRPRSTGTTASPVSAAGTTGSRSVPTADGSADSLRPGPREGAAHESARDRRRRQHRPRGDGRARRPRAPGRRPRPGPRARGLRRSVAQRRLRRPGRRGGGLRRVGARRRRTPGRRPRARPTCPPRSRPTWSPRPRCWTRWSSTTSPGSSTPRPTTRSAAPRAATWSPTTSGRARTRSTASARSPPRRCSACTPTGTAIDAVACRIGSFRAQPRDRPQPGHLALPRRLRADGRGGADRPRPGVRRALRHLGQHPRLVGPRARPAAGLRAAGRRRGVRGRRSSRWPATTPRRRTSAGRGRSSGSTARRSSGLDLECTPGVTLSGMSLTIAEAAERSGLSPDTLRYYERDGLMLRRVDRSATGHRRYTESDLRWIDLLNCLRGTGMPIREVRRYAELVRAGDGNELRAPGAPARPPGARPGPAGRGDRAPGRDRPQDRHLHRQDRRSGGPGRDRGLTWSALQGVEWMA